MAGNGIEDMFDDKTKDNADGMGDGGDNSLDQNPSGASDTPGADQDQTPPKDDAVSSLQAELRAMREEMAYLKGLSAQPAAKEDPAPDKQEIVLLPEQVFTPEEITKFQEDGDLKILTAGMARVSQAAWTQALAKLPEMIQNAVQNAVSATNTTTKLFDQHKELDTPTRRMVLKAHAETLAKANPSWNVDAVMKAAISQTYKDFNLTLPGSGGQSPNQQQRQKTGNPSSAGGRSGGGARSPASGQETSLQERTKKQIDAMFD